MILGGRTGAVLCLWVRIYSTWAKHISHIKSEATTPAARRHQVCARTSPLCETTSRTAKGTSSRLQSCSGQGIKTGVNVSTAKRLLYFSQGIDESCKRD